MPVNTRMEWKCIIVMLAFILYCVVSFFYGWRVIDFQHGGIDTMRYRDIFNSTEGDFLSGVLSQRVEKGYASFMWLVKNTLDSFPTFLFLYFMLSLYLLSSITKKITVSGSSILSYILLSFMLVSSFNVSRMILGLLFLFFVVSALSEDNYGKAFLYACIATSIQSTCIFGFIFIGYKFVYEKLNNKIKFYILYLISLASAFLLVEVAKSILISIDYGAYVTNIEGAEPSLFNFGYALFLLYVTYLASGNYTFENRVTNQFLQLLPSMFYILPIYLQIPIAYRFNLIFVMLFAFCIPDVLKFFSRRINSGNYFYVILYGVVVTYFVLKVYNFLTRDVYSALLWDINI
ncbi:EpsG family protein [Vibrio lentus]